MTRVKQLTAMAVTVGVWTAAVASAAALGYGLNRTPHFAEDTAQPATPSYVAPALLAEPSSESQRVPYLPTITVVGRSHKPR
jgi:hypothetical protein